MMIQTDRCGLAGALERTSNRAAGTALRGTPRTLATSVRTLLRGKDETAGLTLKSGVRRLIDPMEMGRLFKVLAATSPGRSAP